MNEMEKDLTSGKVMNRLLHGEVGSGKTVVVAYLLYLTAINGYQGVMMAPTEILAFQNGRVVKKLLAPFDIRVEILTRSTKDKMKVKFGIFKGDVQIVVGTHALLEEDVRFKNLAFVSVDEQHRFGVLQRAKLFEKGNYPHTLVLSATPIPRTLALSLYGDLDISFIDELPAGRKPVYTRVYPEHQKDGAYKFALERLKEGEQVFIICPFIEENGKLKGASVKKKFRELQGVFRRFEISLLHGKMKSDEKKKVMEEFRRGRAKVLVATSMVEVGIDIPQATVMIVEDANRFGLLQLHQLRGRIGRGNRESYFLLISSKLDNEKTMQRLAALEKTNSGLEIAELDLRFRGMGELGGEKQHGESDFRVANLLRKEDLQILEIAKKDAEEFLEKSKISDYPLLLKELVERFKSLKYLNIS